MKKACAFLLAALMLTCALTGCQTSDAGLDKNNPVTLTMWHVFGEQADSPMNKLIAQFNETVGLEKGIIIDVTLMSNSTQIGEKLVNAQADKPGELDMPDLFFCHTNNAAALGKDNLLNWNDYFTEEERASFVSDFMDEGKIDDRLVVFPVSKSTHLLFMNGTQFDRFTKETGCQAKDLATWEGFFDTAEAYTKWSGGKPFCAMDYLLRAIDLYMLSKGQKVPMKNGWYDLDDPDLKAAWMLFAKPLVQGNIVISDLYANTQVMTGEVAGGLGSSAAILYYNDTVTYPDNTTEPMNLQIYPMPQAEGGKAVITQAGVGLAAYRTTEKKAAAASIFAHWFTEASRNLEFVAQTGYMPVNQSSFESVEDYPFSSPTLKDLHHTLKTVRAESKSVTEPSQAGFYSRVHALYDLLRKELPALTERCRKGEKVDLLAEEVWNLFCSIK